MSPRNYGVEVKAYPVAISWLSAAFAGNLFWDLFLDRLLDLCNNRFGMIIGLADKAIGSHARPRGTSCVLLLGGELNREAFALRHKPSEGILLLLLAYRPG